MKEIDLRWLALAAAIVAACVIAALAVGLTDAGHVLDNY
jgi:hypothetical protein